LFIAGGVLLSFSIVGGPLLGYLGIILSTRASTWSPAFSG